MRNYIEDPSGETGEGWIIGTTCVVGGASIVAFNPRTGLRSFNIRSRNVGPTCGFFQRTIQGLTKGRIYRLGCWWAGQGNPAQRDAVLTLDAFVQGIITGITPSQSSYQRFTASTVFVAAGPTALFTISQPSGTAVQLLDRWFDDFDLTEVFQSLRAKAESLSSSADGESLSSIAKGSPLDPTGGPGYGG